MRHGRRSRFGVRAGVLLLLALTGCLPSSCRREVSRAVMPADSLSRQIAAQAPVDTLRLAWRAEGGAAASFAYPRTVLFGPDGRLYVSDAERNSLFAFGPDGAFQEAITAEGFDIPYLAGTRGDTLVVFSPDARRIDFVADGRVARTVETPADLPARGRLHYATASDSLLYYKLIGEDFEGYLAALDAGGREVRRVPLPGPSWRHAGLLRMWGDTLLSLSGFRPVVDVLPPGGRLDTMALRGFDSPMLARSRSFLLGEVGQAPLLTPAAAPAGPFLFVLNLRPGWLRVDVYDRAGYLQHVLVQEDPAFSRQFYPVDLAVRARPGGGFALAVAAVEPRPQVAVFRWDGP